MLSSLLLPGSKLLELSDEGDQRSPLVSQPQLSSVNMEIATSKDGASNHHHQYGSFIHPKIPACGSDSEKAFSPPSILKKSHPPPPASPSKPTNTFPLFVPGTVPHGVLVATAIGIACGTSAYVYNLILQWLLLNVWKTWPRYVLHQFWYSRHSMNIEDVVTPAWTVLWIPLVAMVLSIGLGWTVRFVGEPGDLASTIQCVHKDGWIVLSHAAPMIIASLFSIVAGASVGPEAALVAVCATLAGYISRNLFGTDPKTQRNLVRKHTLMGVSPLLLFLSIHFCKLETLMLYLFSLCLQMSGALAAFFGSPLGGSLFALEVCSRFGVEYFEHALEAIFCGEMTLAVFRTLSQSPPRAIWELTSDKLTMADPVYIVYGATIGLFGAVISMAFGYFHSTWVMTTMARYHLLEPQNTVRRALVGASVFVFIGILVPYTLFWSEEEIQTIGTMDSVANLPHVFPLISITGFEMRNFVTALTVGIAKLVTISFSVAGGFRGGVIFPLMASGAAFGRAVHVLFPFIPMQVCVLCFAAAVQVPVTRTALSTTIILAYLAGEPQIVAAVLAASLVSIFCTINTPVLIKTQIPRLDLDVSLHSSCLPLTDTLETTSHESDSDESQEAPLLHSSHV